MLKAPGLRTAALALVASVGLMSRVEGQNLAFFFSLFERTIEPLRVQAGIPALSAAIVLEGSVVWDRAWGHADVEALVQARFDTPYEIGDLTQTFTTILLAQCAERARVQPDDGIRRWVPLADPPATIRQLLSHTSGSTGSFRYDNSRFGLLTAVVEECTAQPFRRALAQNVLNRTAMLDAVPGRQLPVGGNDLEPIFDAAQMERYNSTLRRLAVPYKLDSRRRATRADPPSATIGAASGLIASVSDLAKFDAALDRNELVRADTMAEVWAATLVNGGAGPMTMGWFSQLYEGHRLVWHFGMIQDGYSSLVLKVPSRRLTLILLANSDGLSSTFALHEGDVTTSHFARTFLRLFL